MQMGVQHNKKLLQPRQATAWATICSKKKKFVLYHNAINTLHVFYPLQ